jgi:hypothetical protein
MTLPKSQSDRMTSKRAQSPLTSKLEKNLWAYAAVASAAGVGMLASGPAAEAKVVYTPAHATLASTYALDLNHDGTVDFYFVRGNVVDVGGSDRVSYLQVCHMPSQNFSHICVSSKSSPIADNAVRILTSGAAALPAGAKIANGEKFEGPGVPALMAARHYYSNTFNTAQHWDAPWANGGKGANNRYLGFKFKINGQFHYGWARLTVTTNPNSQFSRFSATLTGYAYETIPNKDIVAGQESGPDETGDNTSGTNPQPFRQASLGLLGLGAAGLAIWRRKEDSLD